MRHRMHFLSKWIFRFSIHNKFAKYRNREFLNLSEIVTLLSSPLSTSPHSLTLIHLLSTLGHHAPPLPLSSLSHSRSLPSEGHVGDVDACRPTDAQNERRRDHRRHRNAMSSCPTACLPACLPGNWLVLETDATYSVNRHDAICFQGRENVLLRVWVIFRPVLYVAWILLFPFLFGFKRV